MKKIHKSWLTAILVGLLAGPQFLVAPCQGAASGNYTDLLPIGAAGNTTVISNGSGWSLTTLPPTQTFGDSLSRLVDTVWQSTAAASVNSTTTVSTFTALGQGSVGSTTIPASWVATGRSIEVVMDGTIITNNPGPTWQWQIKMGTTSILNTGSLSSPGGQTNQQLYARAIITVAATGNSGTAMGTYDIFVGSGASTSGATMVIFSTTTSNTASVDWTSQLTVNPTLTWGTANSSITVRNVSVKLLN